TLNFPSTEVHRHDAVFNLSTQVLDFPRTARELECCDFGPRAGLVYRLGGAWGVRSGYGMIWFEPTGITTPFTLPQFPFVQTVGQQSQDNVNPAFALSGGPTVQVTTPIRIGNPNAFANRSSGEWFDKSAFIAAGQFSIGNSSRNPVRGPGLQDADLMIGKTFR